MASNSFGNIFKITTFGESHGSMVGVTIDGCPAGINITAEEINKALSLRAPGKNQYTSPRLEKDKAEIVSGVFENTTTGTPVTILIKNKDHDSSKYEPIKNLLRPGHANYTYLEKYGIFDYKGGGRASARETAVRVAAGVLAQKILDLYNIKILSYINSVYNIFLNNNFIDKFHSKYFDLNLYNNIKNNIITSEIFCPDEAITEKIKFIINKAKTNGDSLGATVGFIILNCPVGLGEPVYEKLEAKLASAMLSIPASKGFEIGHGFKASQMLGSEHNDEFVNSNNKINLNTNNSGGTLGGISNGMAINGLVAFKPTSSIKKTQNTVDLSGNQAEFKLPEGSRHDPCVAIRAVPIVEAMCALVIADLILINRSSRI